MERRDALLCYCEEIGHDIFVEVILDDPSRTLDEACAAAGIGTQCTACLLNAEHLYIETLARAGGGSRRRRRPGRHRLPSKRAIYAWIDRRSPRSPNRNVVNMPVFAGPGVRTIVSIANSICGEVRGQPAAASIRVRILNAAGAVVDRVKTELAPGQRLDRDVSDALPPNDGDLAVGTCWVENKPLSDSFNGTVRPHFRVITREGVSSLHAQSVGRRASHHTTLRWNPAERQWVALMNPLTGEASAEVSVLDGQDQVWAKRQQVASLGACLVELPPANGTLSPQFIRVRADVPLRYHIVVASENNGRISVDHI